MSPKTYERLTNLSFLAAVTSALIFDRGVGPHWLIGGIGVLAGVVAVLTYFINQGKPRATDNSEEHDSSRNHLGETKAHESTPGTGVVAKSANWSPTAKKSLYIALLQTRQAKGHFYYPYCQAHERGLLFRKAMLDDAARSARFVDEVTEIALRLSNNPDVASFEFTIARDGSFTIRSVKAESAWSRAELSQLEEEPAGQETPATHGPN